MAGEHGEALGASLPCSRACLCTACTAEDRIRARAALRVWSDLADGYEPHPADLHMAGTPWVCPEHPDQAPLGAVALGLTLRVY